MEQTACRSEEVEHQRTKCIFNASCNVLSRRCVSWQKSAKDIAAGYGSDLRAPAISFLKMTTTVISLVPSNQLQRQWCHANYLVYWKKHSQADIHILWHIKEMPKVTHTYPYIHECSHTRNTRWPRSTSFLLYSSILAVVTACRLWSSVISAEIIWERSNQKLIEKRRKGEVI